MKKLLVAAGISAMLIVSQTAAYADGAKSEDAPRVVDRVAEATKSPVDDVTPVKLENGVPVVAPVAAATSYNNLLNSATQRSPESACKIITYYYGTDNSACKSSNPMLPLIGAAVLVGVIAVATDDSSESD